MVVVLSGAEDGIVILPGVVDGMVVLPGVIGVVMLPGVPGMLLGVVVESVGFPPAGEIEPPRTGVGILVPLGIIEPPDDGTTTSAPEPPEPLGAAEGLVGVPLGAAFGEEEPLELPEEFDRFRVGPMLEGSAVGAAEGLVGVPLGAALPAPPGVPILSRF